MSKKDSRRRRREFEKKKAEPIDRGAHVRALSRAMFGSMPPPHFSKKGGKGYDRRQARKIDSAE